MSQFMQKDDTFFLFAYITNCQMSTAFNERLHPKSNVMRFTEDLLSQVAESFCFRQRVPLRKFLIYVEKTMLVKALSECNGNQRKAAKLLGMKHTTLHAKVKRYKIRFLKRPVKC